MGKDKASEKEVFELWWEYLKESKGYREWLTTTAKEYKAWLKWLKNTSPSDYPITMPTKFTSGAKWEVVFNKFGNVHEIAFEEWWKQRELQRQNNPLFKELDDYSNWVGHDILQCFTNMKDKPIDLERFEKQFRVAFVDRMKSSGMLHLAVDVNADLDNLTTEFRRMVLKHKKEKKSKLWPFRIHQYPSVTRMRLKEIQEYLRTHRESLRHKTWKTTMYAVDPAYKNEKDENVRSLYYTHLRRAKSLIVNAENGNFPDNYR